jgi:hypothetical protein
MAFMSDRIKEHIGKCEFCQLICTPLILDSEAKAKTSEDPEEGKYFT